MTGVVVGSRIMRRAATGTGGRPNMGSMVGCSTAPKGVDRKSEGRSVWWWFESQISEQNESRILRNAPLTNDGIDPPVKPDAVVREGVTVEIYRIDMVVSNLSLVADMYVEGSLPKRWYCARSRQTG